jgi:hypothetical protein
MWSTGESVKPTKSNGVTLDGFTSAWSGRTALYLSDIERLPPKTWKKINAAATKFVEKKRMPLRPITKIPLRRQIIDADESD